MSELAKTILVLAIVFVVTIAIIWKALFWSDQFPPNGGWSKRQLKRMKNKKSPWGIL